MHRPKVETTLNPTIAELFFIERSQELLSSETIETYRLPLHNPKTLLRELNSVIKGYNASEIQREEYAILLADEASALFKTETYLQFNLILLKSLQIALTKHSLQDIYYSSSMVLAENENYVTALFSKLRSIITSINGQTTFHPANLKELNEVIKYLFVELHQLGYSKAYLYRFTTGIFKSPTAGSFHDRLGIIQSLITRPLEDYQIIVGFVIKPTLAAQLEILDPELTKVDASEISKIIKATNPKIREFFSQLPDNTFYKVDLQSRDYYTASNQVRKNLQLTLDVLYMGYSGEEFALTSRCIVIGSVNPRMAGIHNLNYQLEGHFKNDQQLYRLFSERIQAIKEKNLTPETLIRIESALRYLRLGSSVKELENKLLNYWIGMEYFFASNDSKNSKTSRMREFFKRMHGKIYFKRLFLDFHQAVKAFSLQTAIRNFNEDLSYLKDVANFQTIEANTVSPVLAFRAYMLRGKIFDRKTLVMDLQRHTLKLEWNLMRIYRIRNAIVHSAMGDTNILDITSHLRYYLIFAINSAVDHFNNDPMDINNDGKFDLDDYFLINKVEYENIIIDDSLNVERLLRVRNPIEFLS
jgi:hypothetical protein